MMEKILGPIPSHMIHRTRLVSMALDQQGTRDAALAKYSVVLQAATQPLLCLSNQSGQSYCLHLLGQVHTSFLALLLPED